MPEKLNSASAASQGRASVEESIPAGSIPAGAAGSARETPTRETPTRETPTGAAAQLRLKCNLVMKGGITSGIVYPAAVKELAKQYRFRRIGGASAGAIAAALTAAAEYGRQSGGFERLQDVGEQLGQPGFLQGLFQPTAAARPLFEVALAIKGRKSKSKSKSTGALALVGRAFHVLDALTRHMTRDYLSGALLGALGGGATLTFFLWLSHGSWNAATLLALVVFVSLCSGLGGLLSGINGLIQILLHRLTYFGICSGHAAASDLSAAAKLPSSENPPFTGNPPFTDWLSDAIDSVAGSAGPLTFDDLEGREVTLQMVTSNLSQERPYLLPLEKNLFLFRKTEMEQFFPARVVEHLLEHQYRGHLQPPEGFHYLPPRGALPVVVAMRLSLSFPLLISAVPFYTVSASGFRNHREGRPLQEADLQRNVFSDGGISSNFPIHFFDSWWPSHPTFGINLTSWPKDALKPNGELKEEYLSHSDLSRSDVARSDMTDPSQPLADEISKPDEMPLSPVFMTPANRADLPDWHEVTHLPTFLGAIFSTSQNYRDQMQSALPSYRERIVNIRLANNEGGLNLDMPAHTIAEIVARGTKAGEMMRDFELSHHQWTRLLVLMSQLEQEFEALETSFSEYGPGLDELLERQESAMGSAAFPFRRNQAWCAKARPRLTELRQLLSHWKEESVFAEGCPKPEPHLRISPRV